MRTVTLEVASRDAVTRRASGAFGGKKQGSYLSFATPEMLWSVLTIKRWKILRAMTGAGPMAIRAVARRVRRDVKPVRGDVRALLDAGLLRRTANGKIEFPYDVVRVNFTLRAA